MKANIRPLSEKLADIAKHEINEDPDKIQEEIDKFKEWILNQNHIRARTDDQFLVAFLRGCKYDQEKARRKIDAYYKIRMTAPEHLQRDLTERKLLETISLGVSLTLPIIDEKTGARVQLFRQAAYDPYKFHIDDILKVNYMISDICIWEDDCYTVCGGVVIVDMKGFSFAHIAQYSPSLIKKVTTSMQTAYPARVRGIHFINLSTIAYAVYKLFYNFLPHKLRQRIIVHGSLESLHQYFPKHLLPLEYGGEEGTVKSITEHWVNRLKNHSDWFIEDAQYKTDETKRLAKVSSSYKTINMITRLFTGSTKQHN